MSKKKRLPNATPEEVVWAPMEARHVPVGAMIFISNAAHDAEREIELVTDKRHFEDDMGFVKTWHVRFHLRGGGTFTVGANHYVSVILGARSARLVGKLAFYQVEER